MIKSIDHIAIIVSSEEGISFYKRLGFKELYRKERINDTVVIIHLEGDGTKLEIFIDPNHPERVTNPEAKGLRHLAFKVNSIEETLKELDIEAGPVMNDWIGDRYCFISDPDGLPIELHE
ncbi:MAG: VOC family protein [Clostridiales bacterium]|nr:VOC family protein [Clostridiales bacterium]MBR3248014.1 VOC family protein [Clostridiales bacterium]